MGSLPKILKDNLSNILTSITIIGLGVGFLATKGDIKGVNTNIILLRVELTIRVNENKLVALDGVVAKTPAQRREVEALITMNAQLVQDKMRLLNETN